MRLKQDEVYICTEPNCEAEIIVRKGAKAACEGKYEVRCCCGKEMAREDSLQFVKPLQAGKQAKR